jgi:hypothetical protein
MSSTLYRRCLSVVAALLAVLFSGVRPASAERLSIYHLDSLTFMSTEVVEVELIRRYEAHGLNLIDVTLTKAHKGGLEAGQTIAVADTDCYSKGDFLRTEPLAVGDKLVMFLKRAPAAVGGFKVPREVVLYLTLPGGIRLVRGDEVLSFSPGGDWGGYIVDRPAKPGEKRLTQTSFNRQVDQSIYATAKMVCMFAATKECPDDSWLLDLLGARSKVLGSSWWDDPLAELACQRLAATQDPEALGRAIHFDLGWRARHILHRGLGTPKGREYLLARIQDDKAPMAERLRFAEAIQYAGAVYHSMYIEVPTRFWRPVKKVPTGNAAYLTRIARTIRENARHEVLCLDLIDCLALQMRWHRQDEDKQLRIDVLAALGELKRFYDAGPSQRIRYAIEDASVDADPDAYGRLKSPCGKLISILKAADPARYTKLKRRGLIFEYSYNSTLLPEEARATPFVVLVHQTSQRKYAFPSKVTIHGRSSGGGSSFVEVPDEMPSGKYRVFFEFREKEKVVSSGHFFEAEL